jgi:hypothetical protein
MPSDTDHQMPTCNVCDLKPGVGVASSCLVAMSFSFCEDCLTHHAEPYEVLHFVLVENGPNGVADWVKTLSTFKDGKYISWDEFVALDAATAALEFKEKYGG